MTSGRPKNRFDFLIQGTILAAAGILVRIIGMIYRIPLLRIIGDEGMGYYSVAFEVYSVVLLISSYSMPLAISKMISARIAKEDYFNANRIFKLSLIYATVIGALGCAFVYFSADWFADVFYMLPLCKYALISLAPTIWIMAYLSVFRGYYQGMSTMVPTAVSQIFEQIINALVSVGASWWLCHMALNAARGESVASAWGAAGGTIGTGAGALTALITLIILFIRGNKKWKEDIASSEMRGIAKESIKELSFTLILTIVPVILSTAVYNISGIIDSEIFTSSMVGTFGIDPSEVAAQYGAYTGRFKTLINIPIAISNSLASSIIPVMSRSFAEKDYAGVGSAIAKVTKFTALIAFPASMGLTVIGGPIITLLFGTNELASNMAAIGSFAVLFYSVSTVSNAVLQGTNNLWRAVSHAVASLVIHILALYFMIYYLGLGVYSVVLANMVFAICMCIMNGTTIRIKLGYKQEKLRTYIIPFGCSVLMGIATYFLRYIIETYITKSVYVITAICMIVAIVIYGALIVLTGCLSREELKSIPLIKKLVK